MNNLSCLLINLINWIYFLEDDFIKTAFHDSRFVERNDESDYVEIDLDSISCRAAVGKIGGKQRIRAGGCIDDNDEISFGKIVHEMMHTIGRYN